MLEVAACLRKTREPSPSVKGTAKYWHFMGVAWLFVYLTLYLVKQEAPMGRA